MPKIYKHDEQDDAIALATYLRIRGIRFSHIAQETPAGSYQGGKWTPNWNTIRRNKEMGVTRGVPDFIILGKNKIGVNYLLFIELKKKTGGVVSLDQKAWIDGLNQIGGGDVLAKVAHGFEEAKAIVDCFI